MTDEPFAIVDDEGVEHRFPAGFDMANARRIVMQSRRDANDVIAAREQERLADHTPGREVARVALDTLPGIGGLVGGALSTPETLGTGTVAGAALGVGAGRGLRDLIAHYTGLEAPTSPAQKGLNIAKDAGIAAAAGYTLPGVMEIAKAPIQAVREGAEHFGQVLPESIRRMGKLFPSLPKSAEPILERPAWQSWGREAATDAPSVKPPITGTGMPSLRTGSGKAPAWSDWRVQAPAEAPPPPPPPRTGTGFRLGAPVSTEPTPWSMRTSGSAAPTEAAARPPASSGLTAAEKTLLAKQGYTPELIARIEQTAGNGTVRPVASHPPAPSVEPPINPDLQQPRIERGAERVGRQMGKTKEQVRMEAGPVLSEQRGEASMILPENVLEGQVQKMRAMPKDGPERAAHVAAAKDPKTQAQLENLRRTLKSLGLATAGAAVIPDDVRQELLRMMGQRSDR